MKILQLTNKVPYPPSDGGVIAVLSLAVGLADLGHQTTILSMSTLKHNFNIDDIPEEFSSKIKFLTVNVPAKISPVGLLQNFLFSDKPYTATRFISIDYSLKLIELLSEENFDIIQLEGLYLAPYIDLIKRHTDAPIVMRAHNVEHEIWERVKVNTNNQFKKIYLRNLNRKLKKFELSFLNNYDLLLPITDRDGQQFKMLGYKGQIYTLPTGIESGRYQYDLDKTEYPSVFHLGSLDWEPNLEGLKWFLAEVWPKVLETHKNVKFYIAGRNASDSLVKYLENQPNVVYHGEVADANEYINSKAIMIVPLLSGSGMRIKVIEGLALAKAIVSTSVGMEGISADNGTEVLIADEPDNFANRIMDLLSDKEKFVEISNNARAFVEREFDNQSIVKGLIESYKKLLEQKLIKRK
jgi:glycosyltransferase involved in cell wall biosynthesis